jgi:Ca-activated chloride channel family protein
MINYFSYDYPQANDNLPFSVNLDAASCPWAPEHRLVRIGLKGREMPNEKRPASNVVFLLDVSGSMEPANRLPLVKQAMRLLVEKLSENDRVAIVVYSGSSGLALPSTTGDRKEQIPSALENLEAGGSTNGAQSHSRDRR